MTDDPLVELILRQRQELGWALTPAAKATLVEEAGWLRAHRAEVLEALDGDLFASHATWDEPEYDGGRKWWAGGRWLYPGDEIWTFNSEGRT